MKKRNIKFPLIMKDEVEVRTIEELRDHFDLQSVLGYFFDGKLKVWLNHRYYEDEAILIEELEGKEKSNALIEKICETFGVEFEGNSELDLDEIELRKERMTKLRLYTDNKNIIDEVDFVAFNQEELSYLLDSDESKIYLCSNEFNIPVTKKNITYFGISNPIVNISSKRDVDFDSNNIIFHDVIISAKNAIKVRISKSKDAKLAGNAIDSEVNDYQQENHSVINWDQININYYVDYKDNIYYYDELNGIFNKWNKSTGEKTHISDDTFREFKIVDDIIYFKNEGNLCAIDLDGKNKTLIRENVTEFDVDRDNIYFTDFNYWWKTNYSGGQDKIGSTKPYVVNTKGKTVKSIPFGDYESGVRDIKADNGWFYYVYWYDYYLYRIKSNLTSQQQITDTHASDYHIIGDWIYFVDDTYEKEGIKKIKLNGIGETTLCKDKAVSMQITEKYIYFLNDEYNIYRMNLDGSNKVHLCSNCGKETDLGDGHFQLTYGEFQVIDEWIYYQNGERDLMVFKKNINGGEPIMID